MENVEITVEKGVMTIKVDLKKEIGPSKSQKNIIIATTGGNAPVGEIYVGLNVYRRIR